MSVASISYRSLRRASGEAKDVARKLDNYADEVYSDVYNKLSGYDGERTANITNAQARARDKINDLREAENRYKNYAADLDDLYTECARVDKAVKSKVSRLTAAFKDAHGIRNSKIENAVSRFFVWRKNKTAAGRWINSVDDTAQKYRRYFKDRIKQWYSYEGGKEILIAVLEIAIAVISLCTAGSILAIVGACIALAAGAVNIYQEIKAQRYLAKNDPAAALKHSNINSVQDWLRTSDNPILHGIAGVLDVASFVCAVGDFFTKGYKWIKGGGLKSLSVKNLLGKFDFKKNGGFFKTIKLVSKDMFKFGKDYGSDFINNLKKSFFGDGWKSVKNVAKVIKTFWSDGFSLKTVMEEIIAPNMNLTDYSCISFGKDGQGFIDFGEITWGDLYDTAKEFKEKVFDREEKPELDIRIELNVMEKLSQSTKINIDIPDIYVPEISMPVLRKAA